MSFQYDCILEPACPGDGEQIALLMKAVQLPLTLPHSIWSSDKAGNFVEDLIQRGDSVPQAFTVIRRGNQILAAVYLGMLDGAILMDNVYADAEVRKHQLAGLMIYRALVSYAQRHASSMVAFDAFESARSIRAWHRRMGGTEHSQRVWWHLPIPGASQVAGPEAQVEGLEEAERTHARWGFSQFRVTTENASYVVGRLPAGYFRLTDAAGAFDATLLQALSKVDPSRRLFVIADASWQHPEAIRIGTYIRSVAPYETAADRLLFMVPRWRLNGDTLPTEDASNKDPSPRTDYWSVLDTLRESQTGEVVRHDVHAAM